MSRRHPLLRVLRALALCVAVVPLRGLSLDAPSPDARQSQPVAVVPRRIASLNLCTDQLLLMLVPRARIASLTDWAARPESSYMASAAVGIPVNYALAEGVLPQQPDLVIAGEYNDSAMLHLLRGLGYRVEVVSVPHDLAEARGFILQFGRLVGAAENARALVEKMDRDLAALERQVRIIESRAPSQQAPLAAVYAPNGMTPGRNTVMTEILRRAGFRNLAAELDIDGYGQLALERLLSAQPDVLIYEATAEASGGGSIAHSYLQHPALQALARHAPSVTLPPPLSECVGPMTIAAIERLVQLRTQWQQTELERIGRREVSARDMSAQ